MVISIEKNVFGTILNDDGQDEVIEFTLSNESMIVRVLSYGATVTSLKCPGKYWDLKDVVLGFNDISSYINNSHYFGATIGRYANRISGGEFLLNDKKYVLEANNGKNHLHGGIKGFDKVLWDWEIKNDKVVFSYTSPSMEENYPGDLKCNVAYELKENDLIINYEASASEMTPVNLTNHSYFNLGGHGNGPIHDHVISINADFYTPIDGDLIPTGIIAPVEYTPFDLRQPKSINTLFESMKEGFDHNFCVNGKNGEENLVASIHHPASGRAMKVFSTQPGVQFYTANFLPEDDSLLGKEGTSYIKHGAFCLETQNYPDAVNQPSFPNSVLKENEVYNHTTRFSFYTVDA